jgi:hypothetical protein
MTQYDNLDLDASLASLVEAAKDAHVSASERALMLIYAGLVAMTTGKPDDAKKLFQQAVALDPKVAFPADEAPPKVASLLEDARKTAAENLTTPKVKPKDEFSDTGPETPAEPKEGDKSNLPLILGVTGGAVVVAAVVVVVLVFALKSPACPSGTGSNAGCIAVHPMGAP